jgi:LysM repeat protein
MTQRSRRLLAPATAMLVAALLSGCGEARSPGMIITSDGRMLDNTAQNVHDEAVRSIVTQIQPKLGEHWRIGATIAQLPVWMDDRRGEGGDWMWRDATVAIELVGDGTGEPPLSADEIRDGVFSYLRPRVEHAKEHLTVDVAKSLDPVRFSVLALPAPGTAAVAHAQQTARTYEVQQGDTLAEISTAFYGTAKHWKDIVKANPQLDPAQMRVGQELVIPALEQAQERE